MFLILFVFVCLRSHNSDNEITYNFIVLLFCFVIVKVLQICVRRVDAAGGQPLTLSDRWVFFFDSSIARHNGNEQFYFITD